MLRALIFDVDGTLADTERDGHRVAFNLAFKESNLPWHWNIAVYGELLRVAGGTERLLHFMRSGNTQIHASECLALAQKLHACKTKHYAHLVAHGAVTLRPGIARILRDAHAAGVRLAIATTTSNANVRALLQHAMPRAKNWFSVIGAAEDAQKKKPDPAIYEFVLAQLSLRAEECIAFEDSKNGLRAACDAGMATVVTINDYTRGEDFTGAKTVLSDLGEPSAPAQCIAGAKLHSCYVDLAQLHRWHRCWNKRTGR